ncbi:DUF4198 domain-containing protein [Litorimonas sp.]|uniref:DUF4198 domain-containing protein n=1 Tax=Litorimonas sp. TaxID=1892381 RepID=UPI003A83C719
MMKRFMLVASGLALLWAPSALSHTAWLVPVESGLTEMAQFQVYFGGHEGKLEGYPAGKVKDIRAMDAEGNELTVWRTYDDDDMQVSVEGSPALLLLHFDNGIYTRTLDGESVNIPMSQVDEPLSAVNAIKYHKHIESWSEIVTTAQGQPFELVPLSAEMPKAGEPMQVKVLIDGVPVEGIEIGTGENTSETKTDENGVATYVPVEGYNKIWAGQRLEVTDNPDFTEKSTEYLLTFDAE